MASPHSSNITFIDLTDSKKVDIHISSNLPTIQIYDANTPKYSPNWSNTPLELTAIAYVDNTDITSTLTNDSIKWYRQIGSDTYNEISTGNQKLKISNNELIDENIGWSAGTISYICSIKYNGKSFENKITFARVDTGLNGSDGVDGTGVTILGSYNTLNELHTAHPTGNAGDAYIVDGNLYVWTVDDSTWENVGNIKGPAGKDGKDSKNIVLSGDSQVFKVNKSNTITPETIKITAQAFNTSIASWTYSTNGGRTFLSTAPTGVSRDGNVITINGLTITSNSITIKASDGEISDVFTVYKATDGLDGSKGDDGIPAPIAFLTNENITFSANGQGQVSGTTITSNIIAYEGATKVTPTIGTITGVPTGMTITPNTITASNEIMLTVTITNNATLGSTSSNMGVISIPITYPVSAVLSLTWSKVNAGINGTSASIVNITPSAYYFKSITGKNGTFTPEYIYVYPRFQNVTFSKWEYSVDGGITWVAASGANGLTIGTYSSVANTLRIARTSTLYTDTITSISFRCMSSNTTVYDTVSIAKLFDVDVEEINTRITDGFAEVKTTTDSIISNASNIEQTVATINGNLSSLTTKVSNTEQKITPTAIVSTVRQSTDYINDLGKKVGTNEIISKINQTAESITISASKIGLLGATNIPDLTADKIKGGTLTLGGSSATTQNGQLLVKNASNVDMLKVNKDGLVVKSGHLAVAEDFQNSTYNWDTGTWTTTTNTSQLDLQDRLIQMGIYSPSGYSNSMRLTDMNLRFQGVAQGIGSWGSFVGHDSNGDFVIDDDRGNILLNSNGLTVGGPISGGAVGGNAKLLTNVLCKNFASQPVGYLAIRLGNTNLALNSMITIKGNITSYNNSTSFSASCYYYGDQGVFYAPTVDISNPISAREVYFAEKSGYMYLILGAPSEIWYYPTVSIESVSIGYAGHNSDRWLYNWDVETVANLNSFTRVAQCGRIALNQTIWTGVTQASTITLSESYKNFRFLTCVLGDPSTLWGITLGAFWDDALSELHFGAIFTDSGTGTAGNNFYGANFRINSPTSLTLVKCGTKNGVAGSYLRKIVGWR